MQEKKADRAKIFMPFAALKGFEEALREKEKIIVKKKELCEDEIDDLNRKMNLIEKGKMVKVIYHNGEEYIEIKGLVSYIDKVLGDITIVNTKIKFENILKIDIDEEKLF